MGECTTRFGYPVRNRVESTTRFGYPVRNRVESTARMRYRILIEAVKNKGARGRLLGLGVVDTPTY